MHNGLAVSRFGYVLLYVRGKGAKAEISDWTLMLLWLPRASMERLGFLSRKRKGGSIGPAEPGEDEERTWKWQEACCTDRSVQHGGLNDGLRLLRRIVIYEKRED